jgi:hypothetical protein
MEAPGQTHGPPRNRVLRTTRRPATDRLDHQRQAALRHYRGSIRRRHSTCPALHLVDWAFVTAEQSEADDRQSPHCEGNSSTATQMSGGTSTRMTTAPKSTGMAPGGRAAGSGPPTQNRCRTDCPPSTRSRRSHARDLRYRGWFKSPSPPGIVAFGVGVAIVGFQDSRNEDESKAWASPPLHGH